MKKHTLVGLLLGCILAHEARADFSGYYAFDPSPGATGFYRRLQVAGTSTSTANTWTLYSSMDAFRLQDPEVRVFPLSHLTLFSGYLAPPGFHYITVNLTNTAPASGFLSFDFTLDLGTPSVSEAYYFINGALYALPAGSGSVSNVPLSAGDSFGFGVSIGPSSIANHLDAHAILQVTNFSAPIPEPSIVALVGVGFVAIILLKLHAGSRTPNQAMQRTAPRSDA